MHGVMTLQDMEDAGHLMNEMSLSDKQLESAIEANELILAYFRPRGEYFGLIISFLRRELDQLKEFLEARRKN